MRQATLPLDEKPLVGEPTPVPALPAGLKDVYERHFDFVWRNARRLGVPEPGLDDVVQDVFVVVCQRLAGFEGRSSLQTWLFSILHNVVTRQRRTAQRRQNKLPLTGDDAELNEAPATSEDNPDELAAQRQAASLLYELLDSLDEDKKTAFILVELEQRPQQEVADAMGVNVNTIHSRVRAARRHMEAGIARHRARENWRMP